MSRHLGASLRIISSHPVAIIFYKNETSQLELNSLKKFLLLPSQAIIGCTCMYDRFPGWKVVDKLGENRQAHADLADGKSE